MLGARGQYQQPAAPTAPTAVQDTAYADDVGGIAVQQHDSVYSVDAAEQCYREAVEWFQEQRDSDFTPPQLVVDTGRSSSSVLPDPDIYLTHGFPIRPETHTVTLGRDRLPADLDEDTEDLKGQLVDAFQSFYNTGLHLRIEEEFADMRQDYPFCSSLRSPNDVQFDPDREQGAYCYDFTDDGVFCSGSGTVHIPAKHMDRLDLDSGRFNYNESSVVPTIRHELAHHLHFENNTALGRYAYVIKQTTEDRHRDVRRASIEALSQFEKYLAGGIPDHYPAVAAFESPDSMFDFLQGMNEVETEQVHDTQEIKNPYRFSLFTALTLNEMYTQQYSGEQVARFETRKFLLNNARPPEALRDVIIDGFSELDVPNIPLLVHGYHNRLAAPNISTDDLVDRVAEDVERAETPEQYFYAHTRGTALQQAIGSYNGVSAIPASLFDTVNESEEQFSEDTVDEHWTFQTIP